MAHSSMSSSLRPADSEWGSWHERHPNGQGQSPYSRAKRGRRKSMFPLVVESHAPHHRSCSGKQNIQLTGSLPHQEHLQDEGTHNLHFPSSRLLKSSHEQDHERDEEEGVTEGGRWGPARREEKPELVVK